MGIFGLIVIGAAGFALAYAAYRVTAWIVNWAIEAVRSAIRGVTRGLVQLVQHGGSVMAYALGRDRDHLQVVEEIEVDENDLDEDVLEALREHGAIRESFHV